MRRFTRLNSTRAVGVALIVSCSLSSIAIGQQFQDETASRFPADPNEYTNQITVGDLDGDGDLDIIFANGGDFDTPGTPQQLRIYINNGAGVFTDQSASWLPPGSQFIARGVELGDVDGDGDLDVIIAQDFNRQPQLLINNGGDLFTNETAARLPAMTLSSGGAQFADVDNDGDLDLYLIHGGAVNRLGTDKGRLWINNGAGVFADETDARMPNQNVIQPWDCIFGDVDGNFTMDLLIASRNPVAVASNNKLYKNNGAGVFTQSSMPSHKTTVSLDFGDIDADNDLDVLAVNAHGTSTNSEWLGRNNASGTFTTVTFPALNAVDGESKFIDYDNDGDLDLIVCAINGPERVYLNSGTGTYSLQSNIVTQVTDSSLDVEVADFNGDGRLDIVTAQGESGSFTNRIYMNVTGPADTVPPRIAKTEQVPDSLSVSGPWHVRTLIVDGMSSDRGFHTKGVTLNYSVTGQRGVTPVPMQWVGNSMYRGVIPPQPTGSVVTYFVTARDFADNLGTGPVRTFDVLWPPCPADVNVDHVVNVTDLLAVINNWGPISHQVHEIGVDALWFAPAQVTAKSGDTISFVWISGFHTATSGSNCQADGRFNFSIGGPGTYQYVIPNEFAGPIPFFCIPHCGSGMTGDVSVQDVPADVNNDGVVNVTDLLAVINAWGPCPQ